LINLKRYIIFAIALVVLILIIQNYISTDESQPNNHTQVISKTIDDNSDSKNTLDTKIHDESQAGISLDLTEILLIIILLSVIILFIYSTMRSNEIEYQIQKLEEETQTTNNNLNSTINNIGNEIKQLGDTFASATKDDLNLIQFPKDLDQKISEFTELITKYSKSVFHILNNEYKNALEEIKGSMLVFKDMASDKSKELKEYKEGYDFIKQKNLLLEIIDINIRIQAYKEKFSSSNNDSEVIEHFDALSKILSLLLENNNIEEYSIPIGTDVLESSECDPINEVESTEDENKVNTVAEIISSGYKVHLNNNETKIIKKVKVKIYGKQ